MLVKCEGHDKTLFECHFSTTLHYEINVTTSCRYFWGHFGLKKAEGLQKGQILLLILNPHVL